MNICHSRSIEILKCFLGSVVPRSLFRAIDVAGGDGRLCSNLLFRSYRKVDLFDRCPVALKKAQQVMKDHPRGGHVTLAAMQDFRWTFHYSAIFMVWCSGYLGRQELVAFLRQAKTRLIIYETRMSRRSVPESFIFLMDNVLSIDEEPVVVKGQQVRSKQELEAIFSEAGLLVYKHSER